MYAMFTASGGGSISNDCLQCGAGQYRVDENTCSSCPIGSFAEQPTLGSSGAVACTACANSSHISFVGSDSETDCRPACGPGLLLAPTFDEESTFCTASCPSGTTPDRSNVTCTNILCAPGTYDNGTSCRSCPAGRFSSGEGALLCDECDEDKYSLPASVDCYFACPAGSHIDTGKACAYCTPGKAISTANLEMECSLCPAGRYNTATGSAECSDCEGDSYSEEGALSCDLCNKDYYYDSSASSTNKCFRCPSESTSCPTEGTQTLRTLSNCSCLASSSYKFTFLPLCIP